MMKSHGRRRGRLQIGWSLLLVTLLLGMLAARTSAQEGQDNPPVVSNAVVTPSSLPYTGGEVSIAADVVDDFGVTSVYAEVLGQDNSPTSVQLFSLGGDRYGAGYGIPPNLTGEPVTYGVLIYGTDNQSQMSQPIVAGEIQVEAQPQFDEAPIVGAISVTPRELTAAGGAVTILTEATDNRSITEVHAVVTLPGGGTADVTLEPTSNTGFEGTLNVPANTGATPLQYTIQVVATDDIGQQGTGDGGAVTVAGIVPPTDQSLKLSPGRITFGKVILGRRARQQFVLRNGAKKGSATIKGVLLAPSAPFRLVGASDKPGPAGLAFSLRPGERRTFNVEFRPTSIGNFDGEVVVQRTDGNQAGLSVQLKGKGQRPGRR